jgi:hypothetical protein
LPPPSTVKLLFRELWPLTLMVSPPKETVVDCT